MALPLALLPVPRQRYFIITPDGLQPLQGSLSFFLAGTSTPTPVYADHLGVVALGTFVNMNADGYLPAIYIPSFGIRAVLTEAPAGTGAQIWAQDNILDPGAAFLADFGAIFTEGSKSVASGYAITDTDFFITVDEPTIDPALIQLQKSADRGQPITIKNLGDTTVSLVPDGVETIDGIEASLTLPAAVDTRYPTVTLFPLKAGTGYLIHSGYAI